MEKKDLLRIGMYIGLAFLIIIIILTIFHFTGNKDNVVIDLTPTEDEPLPFLNETDYSEAYLRDLVEEKRNNLQKVIDNMVMYNLNDEDEETSELAVSQLFLDDLKPLLADDLMDEVYDNLESVNPDEIIDVDFKVYKINDTWLEEIKNYSAIANNNVREYKLNLVEAHPEEIEAYITVVKCEKVCDIKEDYLLGLELDEETNTWKINKIR